MRLNIEMIDVASAHLELVRQILARYAPDCEIRIFGSRVNAAARPFSDLDIALVGRRKIDRRKMNRLREAFEESKLPFRVDVLDWNAISSEFRAVIDKQYEILPTGDPCKPDFLPLFQIQRMD
jgi:predicted nucleotidyltransferase